MFLGDVSEVQCRHWATTTFVPAAMRTADLNQSAGEDPWSRRQRALPMVTTSTSISAADECEQSRDRHREDVGFTDWIVSET